MNEGCRRRGYAFKAFSRAAPKSAELMPSTSTDFSTPNSAVRTVPLRARATEKATAFNAGRTVGGGELGGSVCRFPLEDGQRQVGLLDLGVVSGPEFTAEAWRARSRAGHGTGGSAVQQFSTGAHRMPLLAGDDWQRCTRSSMSALEAWKAMLHRTDAIAGSRVLLFRRSVWYRCNIKA